MAMPTLPQVREALRYFDKDGTGKVPMAQLHRILQHLGSHPLSSAELDIAVSEMKRGGGREGGGAVVIDQSNMVDLAALAAWWVSVNPLDASDELARALSALQRSRQQPEEGVVDVSTSQLPRDMLANVIAELPARGETRMGYKEGDLLPKDKAPPGDMHRVLVESKNLFPCAGKGNSNIFQY